MRQNILPLIGAAAILLVGAAESHAQSARGATLQVAGRWTTKAKVGDAAVPEGSERFGWEAQIMGTSGRTSIGFGWMTTTLWQPTDAPDLRFSQSQGFLEYRYLLGAVAKTVAVYMAGRYAYGSYSCPDECGTRKNPTVNTLGGGGGVLVALGPSLSIDVGAQYYPLNRWTNDETEFVNPNRPHGMLRAGLSYHWDSERK